MFNLTAFSTKVKKSFMYNNVSKSKAEYYDTHNVFVNKKRMSMLLDKIVSKNVDYNTVSKLVVNNVCLNSEFDKENGSINFEKIVTEYNNYKVIFYRKKVEFSIVLTQLHFYNDKLFYANSTYSYLGESEDFRRQILLNISKKHSIEITNDLKQDLVIEDVDNNKLMIVDNGRIVLHYVCGDYDLLNSFRQESNYDIPEYIIDNNEITINV